jgi:hypothetical protein
VCHVVQIQVQTFAVHSVQDMEMDDLEAELAELEAEELDNQLLEPAPVPAGETPQPHAACLSIPSLCQQQFPLNPLLPP